MNRSSNGSTGRRRETVLIVDDDPEIRRQLWWALANEYDLLVAADSREAEEFLVRGERPAAAIVDLHLPPDPASIEAGIAVIRVVKRTSGQTRVIVLSADTTSEARERSRRAGAERFLEKPAERIRILRALKPRPRGPDARGRI